MEVVSHAKTTSYLEVLIQVMEIVLFLKSDVLLQWLTVSNMTGHYHIVLLVNRSLILQLILINLDGIVFRNPQVFQTVLHTLAEIFLNVLFANSVSQEINVNPVSLFVKISTSVVMVKPLDVSSAGNHTL
jgi:hypothetical protein